jgi:hypothetical protein
MPHATHLQKQEKHAQPQTTIALKQSTATTRLTRTFLIAKAKMMTIQLVQPKIQWIRGFIAPRHQAKQQGMELC